MKHLQKSLALFLCVVLCLSFFPFSAAYAEEADCEGVASNQDEIPILEEIDTTGEAQSKDDSLVTEEDDSVSETVLMEESFLDAALDIEGAFTEASAATIVASGTCGAQGDNLTWILDDEGTLTISGSGEMCDYTWASPSPWGSDVTEALIENSVTSIGDEAFKGCTGLTSITIPNSVTSIGEGALSGCTGLTSMTIPNSVTSIEIGAFNGCTGLTSITFPNSVTYIGSWAFSGCTGLTDILQFRTVSLLSILGLFLAVRA